MDALAGPEDRIDVLILCGGSRTTCRAKARSWRRSSTWWTASTPMRASPRISPPSTPPRRQAQTTALISAGWDPGMFSINRVLGEALLPDGATTLLGRGPEPGHS